MILIGLTGPIGHGKTTFAGLLTSSRVGAKSVEASTVITELVNFWLEHFPHDLASQPNSLDLINAWVEELETILVTSYGLSTSNNLKLQAESLKEKQGEKLLEYLASLEGNQPSKINASNKEKYRPILQWLGAYLVEKVRPTIWFDILASQAEAAQTSCPLFVICGLRYPTDGDVVQDHSGVVVEILRPKLEERDLDDPTEELRSQIDIDTKVINSGSLEDLAKVAKQLLLDIENSRLNEEYKS